MSPTISIHGLVSPKGGSCNMRPARSIRTYEQAHNGVCPGQTGNSPNSATRGAQPTVLPADDVWGPFFFFFTLTPTGIHT